MSDRAPECVLSVAVGCAGRLLATGWAAVCLIPLTEALIAIYGLLTGQPEGRCAAAWRP